MADITLTTANKVEVVVCIEKIMLVAAEAIVAGAAVRIDTTTGKATNANGTTAGEARVIGIAAKTVASGMPVTVIKQGIMDGFVLAGDYDDDVFLSDTDGTLADAAGTVSKVVGRIIPGNATTLGTAADKLLLVSL